MAKSADTTKRVERKCPVDGCERASHPKAGFGMCQMHYQRRKKGTPMLAPPLTPKGQPRQFLENLIGTPEKQCISWPYAKTSKGYGIIVEDGHVTTASRLMCELAYGPPPTDEHEAAHDCGNGDDGCVNPNCLRWAPPADNNADKVRHGTLPFGEAHYRAQVSNETAVEIYAVRGRSTSSIARDFGVSVGVVKGIRSGSSFARVTQLAKRP